MERLRFDARARHRRNRRIAALRERSAERRGAGERRPSNKIEHLHFGARERHRRKQRRMITWVWIFSMIGMIAGLPGTDLTMHFVQHLFGERVAAQSAGAMTTSQTATGMMRFQRGLFTRHPKPSPSPSIFVTAPTPTPATTSTDSTPVASTPEAPADDSIEGVIYSAAAEFGLSGSYLVGVANCESHLNPSAYNAAGYYGLFQFDSTTWSAYGYGSIYDPVAQARTAARLISAGQSSRWPNCA